MDSNLVERGTGLPTDLGRVGAFLDGTDFLTFSANTVRVAPNDLGVPDAAFSRGLQVYFGKTMCLSSPWHPRTLTIENNVLEGPGEGEVPTSGNGTSGVFLNDVCGDNDRTVDVLHNTVSGFNFAGLEFDECVSVQVSCNRIESNDLAVEFRQDPGDSSDAVRFRTNYLEANEARKGLVRSTNVYMTGLGGDDPRGSNELWVYEDGQAFTRFLLEDEPGDTHGDLDATKNSWFKDGARKKFPFQIDVRPELIWTTLRPDSVTGHEDEPRVDVSSPWTMVSPDSCWPGPLGRLAAPSGSGNEAVAEGEGRSPIDRSGEIPSVTYIGRPFPNPTRETVSFQLDVSPDHAGRYRVRVYDVAGRVVADLEDRVMAPGRYGVRWPVRSGRAGTAAAPGVYFLRVSGPGVERNSKVVVLR